MINGVHTLVYSDDATATRAFFRDVLGWPCVDVHDGWLIFKNPPSELGVHPTDGAAGQPALPWHQTWLMCDDIEATIADLRARGADVSDDVTTEGFGRFTSMQVPGAGEMMLYQPRHQVAYDLDG
jgi:predicted enzyme related to lactoylglutathione lyase